MFLIKDYKGTLFFSANNDVYNYLLYNKQSNIPF